MAPVLNLVRPEEPPNEAPRGRVAKHLKVPDSPEHPGYALTPRRLVTLLREAEDGWPLRWHDVIDDLIDVDATLRNLIEQREGAVAGKDWSIEADGDEGDSQLAAEVLGLALEDLPMHDVFTHQLGANRGGYAGSEMDWAIRAHKGRNFVVPGHFADVPGRRFRIDTKTEQLLLRTDENPLGEPLTPGKWWISRMPSTRIARAGLMRTAAWFALYKRFGTRDWVIYAEKFGLPLILIQVPEEASPGTKATARLCIEKAGSDGGGILEKPTSGGTIDVQIHQASAGDAVATHGALITFCNREMAKLINGATLSNDNADSGGASYALGEVHAATRWETVLRDYARLRESFRTQVSRMFMRFNGLKGRAPQLTIQVVRDLEPKDLIEAAKALHELGMDLSETQLRGIAGLYAPVGEKDTIKGKTGGAPKPAEALEKAVQAQRLLKRGVAPEVVGESLGIDVQVLLDNAKALDIPLRGAA